MKIKNIKSLFILLFLVVFISCGQNKTSKKQTDSGKQTADIQQTKENLLVDQSWAVCYSGYRTGQHPDRGDGAKNPSYKETLEDLQILSRDSNFGLIRLYDCGENSQLVLKVIQENNLNIQVLLGVWLRAEVSNHVSCSWLNEPIAEAELIENKKLNEQELKEGIRLANTYSDIIISIAVGNEALVDWNDHLVSVDTVISYVKQVQEAIKQPVTVADNYEWWVKNGVELAKVVDFLSIHIYPVWEGKDIDEGMSYTIKNIQDVRNAFPNSQLVITEAGWATKATEFGERASEEKQERYYSELKSWAADMNITTFFFEAFDEDWKGSPDNLLGAEKHWGIFTVDRKAKKVMQELYPELK